MMRFRTEVNEHKREIIRKFFELQTFRKLHQSIGRLEPCLCDVVDVIVHFYQQVV